MKDPVNSIMEEIPDEYFQIIRTGIDSGKTTIQIIGQLEQKGVTAVEASLMIGMVDVYLFEQKKPANYKKNVQIKNGNSVVVAVIIILLSISIISSSSYIFVHGTGKIAQQIIRFILTSSLCIYLYSGANWSRWVVIVLTSVAGFYGIFNGLTVEGIGAKLILFILGCIYVAIAITLLFTPSVRTYFGVKEIESEKLL